MYWAYVLVPGHALEERLEQKLWGSKRAWCAEICGWSFRFFQTEASYLFHLSRNSLQFSSVQSLSRVRLFATPWIAALQASLSITNSQSSLIGKDSDTGRDWGQEEKGMTEDEMARWHHGLDGRESEWTPGVGDGQGGLACCESWGRKQSDTTKWLNWTELMT